MNHQLWSSVAARVIAVTFVIAGIAACDRSREVTTRTAAASPSAQLIGTTPAPPTGDPPGTTPVAQSTEVSKSVETTSMPLPGQPNDHSNLASKPSENAETIGVLKSPAEAKTANSGTPLDSKGDAK
jgi:hypothetical protein